MTKTEMLLRLQLWPHCILLLIFFRKIKNEKNKTRILAEKARIFGQKRHDKTHLPRANTSLSRLGLGQPSAAALKWAHAVAGVDHNLNQILHHGRTLRGPSLCDSLEFVFRLS